MIETPEASEVSEAPETVEPPRSPKTMRAAMVDTCDGEPIGFERPCGGRVLLTPELLATAQGVDDKARLKYLLAEARIGCSQRCGCQCASAELEEVTEKGKAVTYVVARCSQSPSALALGHRLTS